MESLLKPGIVLLTPTKTSSTLFLTLSPHALPTCAMHIHTLVHGVARDIICMRTPSNKGGKEGGGERRKVGKRGGKRSRRGRHGSTMRTLPLIGAKAGTSSAGSYPVDGQITVCQFLRIMQ